MALVWLTQLPFILSPAEATLRLTGEPDLTWLDGGLEHGREGRYSFVAAGAAEVREANFGEPQPLALLDTLTLPSAQATGGPAAGELSREDVPHWIGHVAYDAHGFGQARSRHVRDQRVPVVRFARYAALFAHDHATGRSFVAADDEISGRALVARLGQEAPIFDPRFSVGDVSVTPDSRHCDAVRRALHHVREGDVYEINLARRFWAPFQGSALGLFLRMRALSPVPFGYFAQSSQHAVLGRSMERFLRYRVRDRALWTSPIKGTIARQGDDAAEAQSLQADPKEHAEHAMVVDLMRNDLSRVAEVGSVQVTELMTVLPFAGLSHLISTVRATALPDLTLATLLAQTFPPGSVTGTPKERALEIIESLEDGARGLYTGAVGFVDRAGGLSLAVAIRTALVSEGSLEYFAGGGIVWGSDAQRETAETELKAQVFLRALKA